MKHAIEPFLRMGSWVSSHQFFYRAAHHEFELFQTRLTALAEAEVSAEKKYSAEPEHRTSFVRHDTHEITESCYRTAYSALLFACMSFEGFLNFYGVKRLGEDYYKRFFERLGITEKLAHLFSLGNTEVLSTDDEVLLKCRRLFDARNALAHPKAREVDFDKLDKRPIKSDHPAQYSLKQHFDDLEACIDAFCQHDNTIIRSFEFPK